MALLRHVEERQLKRSRPPSLTSRGRYRDVPPLPTSPARVGWTIEASRLLRRRPPSLGTSVCTCSTPTLSKAETADWRRRRKSPTRPSSTGEGWDRVYYVPAQPRPLGEHGGEPHGLRFTRPLRPSRTAAVSRCSMSTGTATPDRGTSTTLPDGSGTTSPTPAAAPVVRGLSPGPVGDVYRSRYGPSPQYGDYDPERVNLFIFFDDVQKHAAPCFSCNCSAERRNRDMLRMTVESVPRHKKVFEKRT